MTPQNINPYTEECNYCRGTGLCPQCRGDGEIGYDHDCPTCDGSGECPVCDGEGFVNIAAYEHISNLGMNSPVRVEVIDAKVDNYRNLCIELLITHDIPKRLYDEYKYLLPEHVSYTQYRTFETILNAGWTHKREREEMLTIFYPWWERAVLSILPSFALKWRHLLQS